MKRQYQYSNTVDEDPIVLFQSQRNYLNGYCEINKWFKLFVVSNKSRLPLRQIGFQNAV